MTTTRLPADFKEFLALLAEQEVDYLVVGGYAVGYHGYPRSTGDMDVWIRRSPETARRLVHALREFGFDLPELEPDLFLDPDRVVRLGNPPLRIEIMTSLSGVTFDDCFANRVTEDTDAAPVHFIGLEDLRTNKRASGRHKDLDDLENLPG
jgi:hypothetical protein